MTEEERHDSSVSRRTMLKRIGIAGAVAWVTPVVTSLNTPASAASGPVSACDQPGACPGGPCVVGADCSCHPRADGLGGFCEQDGGCEQFGPACPNGQSECPTGLVCVTNCCGPICMTPCGVFPNGRPQPHDMSLAGGRRTNG